jgi:hypothetical protein
MSSLSGLHVHCSNWSWCCPKQVLLCFRPAWPHNRVTYVMHVLSCSFGHASPLQPQQYSEQQYPAAHVEDLLERALPRLALEPARPI